MNRNKKIPLVMSILLNIVLIASLYAIVDYNKSEIDDLNAKLAQYEFEQQMSGSTSDSDAMAISTPSETIDGEEMTNTTAETTTTASASKTASSAHTTSTTKRTSKSTTASTTAKPTTPTTTAAAGDNDGEWVDGWY